MDADKSGTFTYRIGSVTAAAKDYVLPAGEHILLHVTYEPHADDDCCLHRKHSNCKNQRR